jgi:hypothetical protein
MTVRGRLGVLAACGVVALLVALYAAWQSPPPAPLPPAGSVRLGPDPGQDVAAYLTSRSLPAPGSVAPALVQFAAEQTPDGAAALIAGGTAATAVFRVPLPRVQTALRFEALDPGAPLAVALDTARQRAGSATADDVTRRSGRARDVAAAEAAALAAPGCTCVLALVVRADTTALRAIAARPGVRAVDAAPPGTTDRELALSPLLPEQVGRADPPPDDGPVPRS